MLSLRNVSKYYGNFLALNNINIEVETGDVVAFLGPNGSGKTTTMRIITGFFAPSSGKVIIDNINIFDEPKKVKTLVGYLPENPPLYPELTVREYLNFVAELKLMPANLVKERVDEVIDLTGLSDKENLIIGSLSKGYKQRVGIAQSIVNNPKLLILDEPTVGLDPIQVVEIRNLIKNLAKEEKRTIILSTHILSEAAEICKKAIIINKGSIIAADEIEKLKELTSSLTIEIYFRRNKESLLKKLENQKEINRIENIEGGFLILMSEDIREKIAKICVEQDCGLIEMKNVKSSLEEVFVKLVH